MAEKLKLEPAGSIVFTGPFDQKQQITHQATNVSANRITTKVKCSDTVCIQVSPVFAVIEPNQTIDLKFQCRFAEGAPNPKKQYLVGILVADAPADLVNDAAKLKDAWASIADPSTIKLSCEFRQPGGEPAPTPTPAAEAVPAETPAPEGGEQSPAP